MDFGQIPFDMIIQDHITGSKEYSILKRWKKYTIYSKSGSWNRTDNPSENLYMTSSIYLYDYVSVTKTWYDTLSFPQSGDQYFEAVSGYSRNHQINKRDLFSLYYLKTFGKQNNIETSGSYRLGQQTANTTIGEDGLDDGTLPVQEFTVGNVNLIQGNDVINR